MRRKSVLAVLGAVGLVAFGLTAWLLLAPDPTPDWASADELVLYSVDGRDHNQRRDKPVPTTGETALEYPVMGKVVVEDPTQRRALGAAFRDATAKPGSPARCFWPRHVVRLRHGDALTEYAICFECQYVQEWVNGGRVRRRSAYINPAARPAFDAPLTAAGVPFAPD